MGGTNKGLHNSRSDESEYEGSRSEVGVAKKKKKRKGKDAFLFMRAGSDHMEVGG